MAVSALRPGDPEMLGPYRLVGRLGRGGMGTVYLGEKDAGRRVAVKVVNPELADDPAIHERFRREVTAARQVRRFCTAPVLDARLDGEPLYVVTEYVDGPALDEAVRERGPMHGGDLEGLAVNIATALRAVHTAGIVHRDLKPSNVLLSPTGPRVIDFGIARALDAVDGLTRTGQFVGTPAYMAPELMSGGELTAAADVFAWGCVVVFAGTGRAPFGGGTVAEIIHRVTTQPPVLDGLDPALRELVAAALAKDPARRPGTSDLLRHLTGDEDPAAVEPRAVPMPPATPVDGVHVPPRVVAPSRRSRLLVPLVAAVAVAAVAAAIVVPALGDGGDPEAETEPSGTPGGAGRGTPHPLNTTFDFSGAVPKAKRVVFRDSFDNKDSGWTTRTGSGREYYFRGSYLVTGAYGDEPFREVPHDRSAALSPQLLDARVQIRSTQSEAAAGMYCFNYGQNAVLFTLLRNGRVAITTTQGGTGNLIGTATVRGLNPSAFNRMQATCAWTQQGTGTPRVQLGMWINGKPVLHTEVPTQGYAVGSSGLIAGHAFSRDTTTTHAVFDDFSISQF